MASRGWSWICCCFRWRSVGRRPSRRRMGVDEQLFLNPFHKCVRYGIFPSTFFLHVCLLALVTLQVLYYLHKDIKHVSSTAQHFSTLFIGRPEGSQILLQPAELSDAVESCVRNIFMIEDVTFNDVDFNVRGVEEADILPAVVAYRNGTVREIEFSKSDFIAQKGPQEYLKLVVPYFYSKEITRLKSLRISFGLTEKVRVEPDMFHFVWNVSAHFDGSVAGRFVAKLEYRVGTVGHLVPGGHRKALNWAIVFFALLSCVFIGRKVLRSMRVLRVICGVQQNLNMEDKLSLFNWWWAVTLLGNALQLWTSRMCLSWTSDVTHRFAWLGWSCFFTWLNICQYFESFPGYYVTFSTTGKGMATVCRYMASIIPILTAFMFLGTCNFWQASIFTGVSASYASLFSLLNGDMVHDAFNDLGDVAGIAGHAYLYVFIFYFIYIVLNVNISIIEEAFFAARFQGLRHDQQVEHAMRQVTPMTPGSTQRLSQDVHEEDEISATAEDCQLDVVDAVGGNLSEPLLHPPDAASAVLPEATMREDSPTRICVKGRMSPRYLDNPRLQGALAAAFPKGASLRSILPQAPESSSLASETPTREPHLSPRSQKPTVDWWLNTLAQWTEILRTVPLPRRSEADSDSDWRNLELGLGSLSAAVKERAAELYR
mmetsp:Transcript_60884/g.170244  ORF Transcript_60884/g.170244 Transcript_60884/m.170244 type:complete len:656 (+) Transcript_60884:48-2015(+)